MTAHSPAVKRPVRVKRKCHDLVGVVRDFGENGAVRAALPVLLLAPRVAVLIAVVATNDRDLACSDR